MFGDSDFELSASSEDRDVEKDLVHELVQSRLEDAYKRIGSQNTTDEYFMSTAIRNEFLLVMTDVSIQFNRDANPNDLSAFGPLLNLYVKLKKSAINSQRLQEETEFLSKVVEEYTTAFALAFNRSIESDMDYFGIQDEYERLLEIKKINK